jgi:hypothetical protein
LGNLEIKPFKFGMLQVWEICNFPSMKLSKILNAASGQKHLLMLQL